VRAHCIRRRGIVVGADVHNHNGWSDRIGRVAGREWLHARGDGSDWSVLDQISAWKDQLLEGAAEVFASGSGVKPSTPGVDIKALHAKIGELTLENDFLESALNKAGLLSAKR
jgi:hypothetical protein